MFEYLKQVQQAQTTNGGPNMGLTNGANFENDTDNLFIANNNVAIRDIKTSQSGSQNSHFRSYTTPFTADARNFPQQQQNQTLTTPDVFNKTESFFEAAIADSEPYTENESCLEPEVAGILYLKRMMDQDTPSDRMTLANSPASHKGNQGAMDQGMEGLMSPVSSFTPINRKVSHLSPSERASDDGILPVSIPEAGRRCKKNKIYNAIEMEQDQNLMEFALAEDPAPADGGLHFSSLNQFKEALGRASHLLNKPVGDCTTPATDPSFPRTDEEMRALVLKVKQAMTDWSNYIEWMQVAPDNVRLARSNELVDKINQHEAMKKGPRRAAPNENALCVEDLLPPRHIREAYMQDIAYAQHKVLNRVLNDLAAESHAWKLVEMAIESQQGRAGCMPWTFNDGS
jgi:hypothetical protein